MALFPPEELPLFDYETSRQLEQKFKQKPAILPLAPRPTEILIVKPQQDYLPIIAIVGIIGLIGLFLAYFLAKK